jgi:hypothetical protein
MQLLPVNSMRDGLDPEAVEAGLETASTWAVLALVAIGTAPALGSTIPCVCWSVGL